MLQFREESPPKVSCCVSSCCPTLRASSACAEWIASQTWQLYTSAASLWAAQLQLPLMQLLQIEPPARMEECLNAEKGEDKCKILLWVEDCWLGWFWLLKALLQQLQYLKASKNAWKWLTEPWKWTAYYILLRHCFPRCMLSSSLASTLMQQPVKKQDCELGKLENYEICIFNDQLTSNWLSRVCRELVWLSAASARCCADCKESRASSSRSAMDSISSSNTVCQGKTPSAIPLQDTAKLIVGNTETTEEAASIHLGLTICCHSNAQICTLDDYALTPSLDILHMSIA